MSRALLEPEAPLAPPTLDLEAMVLRARDGDADAFGALYDALAPSVLRLLRGLRVGLDPAGVEDALQESFLRLLERLPRLDRPARVKGYLLGIAHHVGIDQARARRATRGDGDDAPGPAPEPIASAAGQERDGLVAAALAALPDGLRAALALRHAAGVSMQELADALDCSVPTARARLHEATSRLAIELRARGVDPREVRS